MAVDLFFEPATVNIPIKGAIADFAWHCISDETTRNVLAEEEQALHFTMMLLAQLKYTGPGELGKARWSRPIQSTIRAGLIRTCILQAASIAEACLWDHALARGKKPPNKQKHYSLGAAFARWEDEENNPLPDIAPIWGELQELKGLRDHVHLHQKKGDQRGRFDWLEENEERLLTAIQQTLTHLHDLRSAPAVRNTPPSGG